MAFFKRPKIKQFSYTLRYWDPDKERLEERKRAIAKEMGVILPEDADKPNTLAQGQPKRYFEFKRKKSGLLSGGRLSMFALLMAIVLGAFFVSNLFGVMFNDKQAETQQEKERPKNEDTHFIIPLP